MSNSTYRIQIVDEHPARERIESLERHVLESGNFKDYIVENDILEHRIRLARLASWQIKTINEKCKRLERDPYQCASICLVTHEGQSLCISIDPGVSYYYLVDQYKIYLIDISFNETFHPDSLVTTFAKRRFRFSESVIKKLKDRYDNEEPEAFDLLGDIEVGAFAEINALYSCLHGSSANLGGGGNRLSVVGRGNNTLVPPVVVACDGIFVAFGASPRPLGGASCVKSRVQSVAATEDGANYCGAGVRAPDFAVTVGRPYFGMAQVTIGGDSKVLSMT